MAIQTQWKKNPASAIKYTRGVLPVAVTEDCIFSGKVLLPVFSVLILDIRCWWPFPVHFSLFWLFSSFSADFEKTPLTLLVTVTVFQFLQVSLHLSWWLQRSVTEGMLNTKLLSKQEGLATVQAWFTLALWQQLPLSLRKIRKSRFSPPFCYTIVIFWIWLLYFV